jgi:hypothetical protein
MKRACEGSIVAALGLLALAVAYGQQAAQVAVTDPVIFSVTGSRPLAQAADEFEARYGITVSYEDPLYSFAGDLVDGMDPVYRLNHPGQTALYPRAGSVTLRGNFAASVESPADAMPLLQSLLDDYVKAGNPGEFALVESGDGVIIVPSKVRDANGILSPQQSPLEVRISFPEQERTASEAMDAICGAILANSGKKVVMGMEPFSMGVRSTDPRGLKASYYVTIGARNEPARSVLERTLASLEWANPRTLGRISKMGWRLLYDVNEKTYALNVHGVFRLAPTPTGNTTRQPVFR